MKRIGCAENVTQFLMGHGGYRSYLNRFRHDGSEKCPACLDHDESVEHVIIKFHLFDEERRILDPQVRPNLSPENIVEVMLESEAKWKSINSSKKVVNESLRREKQLRKDIKAIHQ